MTKSAAETLALYTLLWLNVYLWLPPAQPEVDQLPIYYGPGTQMGLWKKDVIEQCYNESAVTFILAEGVSDPQVALKLAAKERDHCLVRRGVTI